MKNYTIGDVSYDQNGEIEQFLIFWDSGEPDTRRATTENILLFDPEDDLPVDGGLHRFFNGESALRLSNDPEVIVAESGDEYSYMISVDGNVVETTPGQSASVLDGVHDALADNSVERLLSLHRDVIDKQVRRDVVNALHRTFNGAERIEIVGNGWLIDGFYLVDWNAKMYANNDDPDEDDYIRSGGSVVQKDQTYELVQLRQSLGSEPETPNVRLKGDMYTLTERETVFLAKVTWLLDREYYHPDKPFWTHANQWATVPAEEPNLDQFTL